MATIVHLACGSRSFEGCQTLAYAWKRPFLRGLPLFRAVGGKTRADIQTRLLRRSESRRNLFDGEFIHGDNNPYHYIAALYERSFPHEA